ncbi:MAG TPA: hypothetical protein VH866_03160 [Candidatus Deferrimicrobiaceae bacterium]
MAGANGGVTSGVGVPTKWRVAVVGEDMKGRVLPYARELEARGFRVETFRPSRGLSLSEALEENAQWVRNLRAEGVPIFDIGPSPLRPMYPGPTSPVYARELQEVAGYWNYWRLWRP